MSQRDQETQRDQKSQRDQEARSMFISSHLKYYITHSIVTAMCLAGLGWLNFVQLIDSGSIELGVTETEMVTLFLASFWLHSAMFIISAFLGPFFQLVSLMKITSKFEDRLFEAALVVVVITEWIMRIAIVFVTTTALADHLLFKSRNGVTNDADD